jgi:hypothetical protein
MDGSHEFVISFILENGKSLNTKELKNDFRSFRRYGIAIAIASLILPILASATQTIEGQWNWPFVFPAAILIAFDARLAGLIGWQWRPEGECPNLAMLVFMVVMNTFIAFAAYMALVSFATRWFKAKNKN